ncbi:MAG: response regulator [Myxococcales bacterium]|nr:response regulator [Myxococcales bacterium]
MSQLSVPSEAPPTRVLFVDDDKHVRDSLRRAMMELPYRVDTAGSAREALELMDGQPYALVLADECMPGTSGSELLGIVTELYPETICMMLTGAGSEAAMGCDVHGGNVDYIFVKPCDCDSIAAQILESLKLQAHETRTEQLADCQESQEGAFDHSSSVARLDKTHLRLRQRLMRMKEAFGFRSETSAEIERQPGDE